jgi:hypothetical protein
MYEHEDAGSVEGAFQVAILLTEMWPNADAYNSMVARSADRPADPSNPRHARGPWIVSSERTIIVVGPFVLGAII